MQYIGPVYIALIRLKVLSTGSWRTCRTCIGPLASPEGLPISYEVFAGNRADVTTVEEIAKIMEDKNGQARRIWVLDRGMISEENIEFLRSRQARCVVTPYPVNQARYSAM